jgi:hypothetical protein
MVHGRLWIERAGKQPMDRQQAIVPNDDVLVQLIETTFRTDDRGATSRDAWLLLPELIESFGDLGCGVVEMVLADHDSWERYEAAQWLNTRRWLDANPHDDFAEQMRAELSAAPARHAYQREYLALGAFALMSR